MKRQIYKGLERPIIFFSIRGDYMKYMLMMSGISVLIGVCLFIINIGLGTVVMLTLLFISYYIITYIQDRYSIKQLEKIYSTFFLPQFVFIRTKIRRLWIQSKKV